ncbi:MAG: hypothetical protein ABL971_00525 [Vicinamibacterales bacterium]
MKGTTVLLGVLVVCAASRTMAQTLADVARAEQERRKAVGTAARVYTNGSLKAEPLPSAPPMPAAPAAGAGPAGAVPSGVQSNTPGGAAPLAEPLAAPAAPAAAASAGPVATALPATLPATEEGWRTRVTGLKDGLARNQVLADALQSRIDSLLTDFVNRDDPAQRAAVEANRIKALAELDRVRTDIKAAQKAVVDLEEQARRAGVPPGWLR